MAKVIPITDYFLHLASRMTFIQEDFYQLHPTSSAPPKAEMLARRSNGRSAGYFFDEARAAGRTVQTDLIIFERAIDAQQKTRDHVSINLNVETIFSPELNRTLSRLFRKHPNLNPRNICLEITEQGGVPRGFNLDVLKNLKAMGFRLALDDYNPYKAEERQRLRHFGEHVDMIKFPHEIMGELRTACSRPSQEIAESVRGIKSRFPQALVVMEGVRKEDLLRLNLLEKLGVDVVQESSFMASSPASELAPS